MRPLQLTQAQRRRDGVEHLDAHVDRAALLEPGVPSDADSRELGEFLPPQARSTASSAWGQADLSGATWARRAFRKSPSSARRVLTPAC